MSLFKTRCWLAGLLLGAPLVALGLSGCEGILDQKAPSRVLADNLSTPESARLLVDGARAAFGCALQAHIMGFGLITDELEDTQLAAAAWDWDRRSWLPAGGNFATAPCDGGQQFGIYTPMQTARFQADFALGRLKTFSNDQVPGRAQLMATAGAFSGYAHLLLAEGFCSMAIDAGPELQPKDVFALSETRFTDAIQSAQTASDNDLLHLAQLGRARARLDLATLPGQARDNAKLQAARADAAAVPAGFVYTIPYNSAASYSRNNIVQRNRLNLLFGVAARYRNMTFGGVPDPRVQVTNTGNRGADARSTVWVADKYKTISSPIALARSQEAKLIVAEADYYLVGPDAAVTVINALHAAVGLPAFAGGTPQQVLDQLIEERSRELFLESQRGYDFIRYNLPFDPPAGTPFQGPGNNKGGSYGSVRCLPLPDVERDNNPNLAVGR